jgi:tripeptide aminopeptidase
MEFARFLTKELEEIGLKEVSLDENGYIMATLPSNNNSVYPTIGFIAHIDTSPDARGKDISPQIIKNYDGKDITLNAGKNIILSPTEFPELNLYIGQDLIVTDGTTLLGADDKAGIAEIVTAMEYLVKHPEIKHGKIRIAFTPDEEIGKGASLFNVQKFGADYAYTIDGGRIGELEYENFNAAEATVFFYGRNVHPGEAKGKMINSMRLAQEFMNKIPAAETPEQTEGYEGFFHLTHIQGNVEETALHYIIRDHDKEKFELRKNLLQDSVKQIKDQWGEHFVSIDLKDQYYNMRKKIEPIMHIVQQAEQAMRKVGIEPIIKPIRGGTDGAQLSFKGLPCPNIFTGGHNFHGKYEFIPIQSMQKAVEVIIEISKHETDIGKP